jgi:hypothetical protein
MRQLAATLVSLRRFAAALSRNLAAGGRLAFGLPMRQFSASLAQFTVLLGMGWLFAFGVDWSDLGGTGVISGWGVAADAARAYWWLAAVALIALLDGRRTGFLPLAVACAAAEPWLWLAWLGVNALITRLPAAPEWPLHDLLWWVMLAWQAVVMARALCLQHGRFRWRIPALTALYALLLHLTLEHSPDEALWQAAVPATPRARLDVEGTYYSQARLLDVALAELADGRDGVPDFVFVGFGAYADEGVFRREVMQVRDIVGARFDTLERSLLLVNSRRTVDELPLANRSNLHYLLRKVAQRMEADEDILFLFLTSHGREDGRLVVDFGELGLNDLEPAELRRILDEAGIKWRVLVVSACFSGAFLPALESPDTLIITAAAHDRSSFGCAHENEWTYFGEAFFRDALADTQDLPAAFRAASQLIEARERREGKEPSRPQMALGGNIQAQLAKWAETR